MLHQNLKEAQYQTQRIYIKGISFEAFKIVQIKWIPEIKIDLDTTASELTNNVYEVVLCVIVTVRADKRYCFFM